MKRIMEAVFNKLWRLGLHQELSYEESKRVVLSNKIFFLYAILTAPYIYLFLIFGSLFFSLLTACITGSCIISLYLNFIYKYLWARVLLILWVALPTYFYSAILGPESGIQYTCFAIMIASYLLFSAKENKFRFIFLIFHIFSYYVLEYVDYRFFYKVVLDPVYLKIIRFTVIGNVFVLIGLTVKFYSDLTEHYKLSLTTMQTIYSITDRETEIVSLLLEGKSNKDIAQELYVEEVTIKKHLQNIFKKFSVKSRAELIVLLKK